MVYIFFKVEAKLKHMPVVFQRDMNVPKDSNHSPQLYVCIFISQTVNYMQPRPHLQKKIYFKKHHYL